MTGDSVRDSGGRTGSTAPYRQREQDGVPERIGPYRQLTRLGAGGMGVVYRGVDPAGRDVAIKVLKPEIAEDPTALRRLAREMDMTRRVRSPHVADVLDGDVTADHPYVVTRFVPGRPLDQVVAEHGPLRGGALRSLTVGLAKALVAIHAAGVVHRDLKPSNVMLVDGEPVVIDFGIAQALDSTRLTQTGMVTGTPGYLAPEVFDEERASPASDVHAWAATVAFAATGRPPFGQGSLEVVFFNILNGRAQLDGVAEPLLSVLRSALVRDPAQRPSAGALVEAVTGLDHWPAGGDDATVPDRPGAVSASPPGPVSASPPGPVSPSPPGSVPPSPAGSVPPSPLAAPRDVTRSAGPGAPDHRPFPVRPPGEPPPVVHMSHQQPPPTVRMPEAGPGALRPTEPVTWHAPPPAGTSPAGTSPAGAPTAGAPTAVAAEAPADGRLAVVSAWSRLLTYLVVATVVSIAIMMPIVGIVLAIAGVFALHAGDAAAARTDRDAGVFRLLLAPLSTPAALVRGAGLTALTLPFAAVCTVVVTLLLVSLVVVGLEPNVAGACAWGVGAGVAVLWSGPGVRGPRRQLIRLFAAVAPGPRSIALMGGVLGVLAFAAVAGAVSLTPSFAPMYGLQNTLFSSLDHLQSALR
jgi:serine/threonine protein kinase